MVKTEKDGLEITELPESYQRYIDVIYDISKKKKGGWVQNKEIADKLGVEPASVSGMLEKLKSNDLIKWEPRRAIRLTEKGKQYAVLLDEIHSLLRIFFRDVLQINDYRVIESVTHEIEHYITQKVKESLKLFLSKYLD
ncbi:MAG: metal-dependent transcriptional regulator [Candidatus Lokiarchaeota archaeon]|jgi:DtxR family Mn-dependent transcriptional regulator